MADVTTYLKCKATYATGNPPRVYYAGEIRASTDPVVTASPANWQALTDTEMSNGGKRLS